MLKKMTSFTYLHNRGDIVVVIVW